jgi:predicted transport protein
LEENILPLYKLQTEKSVSQIKPASFANEKELHRLFEANLPQLLGVQFIASEFTTGDRQRGRIDTLGLDQDGFPTIIEYKKTSKENVINQGLFYLDWLVDHKGDFTLAAHEALGTDVQIDWSSPRLILIAESFSDYDKYAVNRIGANIGLWTYRLYGVDLLYLDPIFEANPQKEKRSPKVKPAETEEEVTPPIYTVEDHLQGKSKATKELFEQLRNQIFELAEEGEITEKANKMYISYKHGKNFCEVRIQAKALWIWIDVYQSELHDPYGLTRDVTNIGHYGTGHVDLKMSSLSELDKVMALIEQSYQQTL